MIEIIQVKDDIYKKVYSYNYTGKYIIFKTVMCDINGKILNRKKRTTKKVRDDIDEIYDEYPELNDY